MPFYSLPGSTDAQARAEVRTKAQEDVFKKSGLIEAAKVLRRAAKIATRDIARALRSDSSPIDFSSHLQRCSEYGEFLGSQLDQALGVMDYEDEDVDEDTRGAFRVAKAACNIHNENMAQARLFHSRNQDAKKSKGKK
jgi:hypothetical protein